jgi:enoyl-CoA hydratase
MTEPISASSSDEVLVRREGRAGRLTLNRPKALNALTWPMVKTITAALQTWANDAAIAVIIVDGAGERGLCAGGDVRWLYDIRKHGVTDAGQFWAEEYRLNSLIARYSKPYVALMDGIVMGGGIGLSAHANHRVVTERSQLAMPETTIGLVPDVGGTFLLAKAQGKLGVYLGLTGERMNGADAIQAGFADHYVQSNTLAGLIARLSDASDDPIDEILDAVGGPVPVSTLSERRAVIDRLFAGETMAEIAAALLTTTDPVAIKARADLATRSPKALALTLEAIRRARSYKTLDEALTVEYRLVTRLYEDGEFSEGVRALLVDKDRAPKWNPARAEDVTVEVIRDFFAPLARDWP